MTSDRSRRLSLAKNTLLAFVSRTVYVATALVVAVLTARFLGPSGRGIFALASVTVSLLQLAGDVGLRAAITFTVNRGRIQAAQAHGVSLAAACVLGVVLWLFAAALWPLLSDSLLSGVSLAVYVAAVVSVPAVLFLGLWAATAMALRRFDQIAWFSLISGLATITVDVVVLVIMGRGVETLVAANTGLVIIEAVALLVLVLRTDGLAFRLPGGALREMLSYGMRYWAGSITDYATLRIDSLILNAAAGNAAVGQYAAAVSVSESLWHVDYAVGKAAMPDVVSSAEKTAADIVAKTTRNVLFINGVLGIVLFAFAPQLVNLAFGEAFAASAALARVLLPGALVYSAARTLLQYHQGQLGRPGVVSVISASGTVASIVLYLWLIPPLGATGAALASTIAYTGVFGVALWLFLSATGKSLRETLLITRGDMATYASVFSSVMRRLSRKGRE